MRTCVKYVPKQSIALNTSYIKVPTCVKYRSSRLRSTLNMSYIKVPTCVKYVPKQSIA